MLETGGCLGRPDMNAEVVKPWKFNYPVEEWAIRIRILVQACRVENKRRYVSPDYLYM